MRRLLPFLLVSSVLTLVTGCTAAAQAPTDYAYAEDAAPAMVKTEESLEQSLFKSDQAVLSNDDIQRILDASIPRRQAARVAVIRFGQRPQWWFWSEELARLDAQTVDRLVEAIRADPRVAKVTVIPNLLVPAQMTVPYLREAAARLQADQLFVYRTQIRSYQRSKLFERDANKSMCTVEAILLDTRTGIVTATATATENFTTRKSDNDTNFYETIGRAEQRATAAALEQAGREIVRQMSEEVPGTTSTTRRAAADPH